MFAQESVMEIQKEREAFEAWFESRYDAHFMQFALDLDMYVDKHTQTCWEAWQAAKAQAVPEGFVLVEKELSWVKADHLACAEWEKNKALFCTENRDITALQIEEYRLRWCKNKAHKIMSEYKAMIEAQEPAND